MWILLWFNRSFYPQNKQELRLIEWMNAQSFRRFLKIVRNSSARVEFRRLFHHQGSTKDENQRLERAGWSHTLDSELLREIEELQKGQSLQFIHSQCVCVCVTSSSSTFTHAVPLFICLIAHVPCWELFSSAIWIYKTSTSLKPKKKTERYFSPSLRVWALLDLHHLYSQKHAKRTEHY